jgi:hypothetical protein
MRTYKTYEVWGEYGPAAYDSITRIYKDSSAENAKRRFIKEMKQDYSYIWETRMGEHNVYVRETTK